MTLVRMSHRSGDGCDCWGVNIIYMIDNIVLVIVMLLACALYLCKDCGIELSESQSEKAVDEDKEQSYKECLEDDS